MRAQENDLNYVLSKFSSQDGKNIGWREITFIQCIMLKTFQDFFENFDAVFLIFWKQILRGSCKGTLNRLVKKKVRFAELLITKSCSFSLVH